MNIIELIDVIKKTNKEYPERVFNIPNKIYTFINPYSYHIYRKNRDLYRSFDGIFVDGILMCLFINLFWKCRVVRRSFDMSSVANDLFCQLNNSNENKSICLIGAKDAEISQTVNNIQSAFPNLSISYYRNGYFTSLAEQRHTIRQIIKSGASYTVIGMGSPLQDEMVKKLHNSGYNGICFTCGGFLHQTSNRLQYYPKWINRLNLRAFYRLYKEKGLFKRLYNVTIQFPFLFIIDTLHSKIR